MIWNFLSSLVSPITNAVTKVSTNKTEVKKRNIDRIMNADDKLAEWEMIQAEKASVRSILRRIRYRTPT